MNQPAIRHTPYFVELGNVFTPAELDSIIAYGDKLQLDKASVFAEAGTRDAANAVLRVTRTAWIKCEDDSRWFYQRMEEVARTLNDQVFNFDLRGFSEPFQYTVYESGEGGHYNWHVDHGEGAPSRKLSFTVQLSDPADYDGCDLQFQIGDTTDTVSRERGKVIAFPSFVLHRVTPAIRGTRKSMVVWCAGPKYR